MSAPDGKSQTTNTAEVLSRADMGPSSWRVEEVQTIARNLLLAAPAGLTARTLCDAIVQQGIPEANASLVIRSGLDNGTIRLSENMQLKAH